MRFLPNKKQLPPIKKDTDNHVLDNPHIFLDEIMRQAQDSEIIKLSMDVREERPIHYSKGKEVQVLPLNEIGLGHLKWPDQILCATNKMRKKINQQTRIAFGHGAQPEVGDKLICLSNYWGITDTLGEAALVNGTIGFIDSYSYDTIHYDLRGKLVKDVQVLRVTLHTSEGEIFENLPIDYSLLMYDKKSLTPEEEYVIYKYNKYAEDPYDIPLEFNWGYAITVHRAQGSSWPKVLVLEEGFPFDQEEHKRWLYTGCTRPETKLILAR